MRWFIAFLLVANGILFFWVQHQSRPVPGSVALPPPDVGQLRLRSEIEQPDVIGASAQSDSKVKVIDIVPGGAEQADQSVAEPATDSQVVEASLGLATQVLADQGTLTPEAEAEAEAEAEPQPTAESVSKLELGPEPASMAKPVLRPGSDRESTPESDELVDKESEARQPVALPGVNQSAVHDAPRSQMRGSIVPPLDPPVVSDASGVTSSPNQGDVRLAVSSQSATETASVSDGAAAREGPPQPACARVGPLDPKDAEALIARLPEGIELLSDVSEDFSEVTGYYVLIPPLSTLAKGLRKAKELKDAGIDDLWLFRAGEFRNAISLGLFTRAATARRHAESIRQRGFSAEVRERTSVGERRWLKLKSVREGELEATLSLPEGLTVTGQRCP